jgi:hypothetical protein
MIKANQLTFFCILIGTRVRTSVAFLSTRLTKTTMDSRLINVFLLGLAFMILNTAFQTSRMLQVAVNLHIHEISFCFRKVCLKA